MENSIFRNLLFKTLNNNKNLLLKFLLYYLSICQFHHFCTTSRFLAGEVMFRFDKRDGRFTFDLIIETSAEKFEKRNT